MIVAILLALLIVGGMFLFLESAKGVDATTITGTGTSYDPYRDTIDIGADEVYTYFQQYDGLNRRVMVGTNFNITKYTSGSTEIAVTALSTGSGLTLSNGSLTGQLRTSATTFTFTVESDDGIHTTSNTYTVLPVRYTVTFVASPNGAGSFNQSTLYVANFTQYSPGSLSNSIEFYTGEVIVPSANPGYEFDHWSSTSGYISSDTTLTAYFNSNTVTYTLSYNANGGSGAPNASTYGPTTDGTHTFTVSNTEPTRSGYEFTGWSVYYGGSTHYLKKGVSGYTTFAMNSSTPSATAYACWVQRNYTLNYSANGGSGAPNSDSYGPTASQYHNFTVSNTTPTYSGKNFLGWDTNPSSSTATYHGGNNFRMDSDVISIGYNGTLNMSDTLYAIWETPTTYSYYLYFDGNGATTNVPATQSALNQTTSTYQFYISNTSPIYSGKIFVNWKDLNTGNTYDKGTYITLTGVPNGTKSVTLTAQWVDRYQYGLTLDYNGGSYAGTSTGTWYYPEIQTNWTTENSHTFTIPNVSPTKSGKSFNGWDTSPSATTVVYHNGDSVSVSGVANTRNTTTLYAVWGEPLYTLTYNPYGGTVSPPSKTLHYGDPYGALPTPTWTGYTFQGWYTLPYGGTQIQPTDTYNVQDNSTIYARWTGTLTFNTSPVGIATINPVTYTVGSTYNVVGQYITIDGGITVTAPAVAGYTFVQWDTHGTSPIMSNRTMTAVYSYDGAVAGDGTEASPYTSINILADEMSTDILEAGYVKIGTPITIRYTDDGTDEFSVYSVTPLMGLTISSGTLTGTVTGNVLETVTITLEIAGEIHTTYPEYVLTLVDDTTYELIYSATGASNVPSDQSYGPTTYVSHYFDIPNMTPTKADNRFIDWYDSVNNVHYDPGDRVTLSMASPVVTLTAVWEGIYKYQITLDYQNPAEETVVVNYPSDPTQWTSDSTYDYTVASMPSGHYTAHTFIGWAEAEGAIVSLQPGDTLHMVGTPNGTTTKTLYAVWIEGPYEYALYFDPNGGTGSTQTLGPVQDSQMSHTFAITGITDPVAPATYSFIGWTTTDTYDGTTPLYNDGDVFTVNNTDVDVVLQTFTLYAVYAMTYTYVLDYHLEGGSDGPDDETVVSTVSTHVFTVSPISPSLAGSYFVGWAFTAHGEVAVYGDDELEPLTGIAGSTVTKHLYAIYVTYDDSVTRWSNDSYNGSVSVIYHLEDPTTKTYYLNESALLFNFAGRTEDNKQAIFTPSGYILSVIVNSVPAGGNNYSVSLTATIRDANNVVVVSENVEIGKWASFIVTLSPLDYTVKLTKVSKFLNFTSYNENETTTILDFSNASMRQRVFETPLSMYELTYYYLGNAPKQQVCRTMVFMETYGTVMTDPVFNVDQYWPNKDSLRLNLYSFALTGNTATINGVTFYLDNGKVTVNYIGNSNPYRLMTDDTQPYKTKVLDFTNLSITWQNGKCYLKFEDKDFTLDLGEYTDRVISFGGNWYFSSGIYEAYTVQEKEYAKDWWNTDFDFQAFALILAGLLTLAGVVMRLKTRAKFFDYLIIIGGIAIALILAGGLIK